MQINLIKLISDLLNTRIRSTLLVQMLFALTSHAAVVLNKVKLLTLDLLYRINADASVISLQNQIKRELDVDAVITELNGQPVDFLVTINGFVDENRLRALITDRKLAGKSFVFVTGDTTYTATWINHVCAQVYTDNIIYITQSINYVGLDFQYPSASELTIVVRVYAGAYYADFTRVLATGIDEDSFLANVHYDSASGSWMVNTHAEILSITPQSDYLYNYKKQVE